MLETILEGKKQDFNDLKGKVYSFGANDLVYDFSQGRAPHWMINNNPLGQFIEEILKGSLDYETTIEEKEWLENLKKVNSEIKSFDKKAYEKMKPEEKVLYSYRQGIKFADLLKPLYKGYVDANDPNCPACPNARKGATQKTWEGYTLDLRRYFKLANLLPFTEMGGEIIPPKVHTYGELE